MIYLFTHLGTMGQMIAPPGGEEEIAAILPFVIGCMVAFVGFLYIVLPAAFFLFYRSPHVKDTCEHYDAVTRWTDRYPVPLLAGIIVLGFSALILFAPLLGTPMPFFGALLTGLLGWIYALAAGLVALALTAGFLRFDQRAWIGSLLFIGVAGISAYLSFRGDGLLEMYEAMGYTQEMIELIESLDLIRGLATMILLSVVVLLVFFGWLGRYFGGRQTV